VKIDRIIETARMPPGLANAYHRDKRSIRRFAMDPIVEFSRSAKNE
jgi:hypothetical protein